MTDTPLPPQHPDAEPTERQVIELREEVLTVERRREVYGAVEVQRVRRTREETVKVELATEVLEITVRPGGLAILVDGRPLNPGEVREVELYREEARPGKEVVVTQEVVLGKARIVDVQSQQMELAYEELDVRHLPAGTTPSSAQPDPGGQNE